MDEQRSRGQGVGMGMDLAYFTVPGDADATEAGARPGGPLGWPYVTGQRRVGLFRREPMMAELGPACPGFTARGYEPTVLLATLEQLLTGRPFDEVTADPRWGADPSPDADEDKSRGVVSLTDSLRDALAAVSDAQLAEVAGRWSRTEELQQDGWKDVSVEDHAEFLRRLRDLARQATTAGHHLHHLYCYYEL
ncbi:hypothetical protein [Blastococcus mobilis]|uniref:hypothetical protein n=1 Tax=Blastococcus mobilis TaxID=1938746 RepID=UPI0015951922|nr:hypothetical protein [Blastococcus mobilis]